MQLAYMAPEVIRATDQYAGQAADIWSCGVMLYVMLFGAYPFESAASRNAQVGNGGQDGARPARVG